VKQLNLTGGKPKVHFRKEKPNSSTLRQNQCGAKSLTNTADKLEVTCESCRVSIMYGKASRGK
jgi:hypothetical protein